MIDYIALSVVLGVAFIFVVIIAIFKEFEIYKLREEIDDLVVEKEVFRKESVRQENLGKIKLIRIENLQETITKLQEDFEELNNQYNFNKKQHLKTSNEREEFISELHEMNTKLSDRLLKYKRLQASLVTAYKLMQDNLKNHGTITT
jgi:chromosome segregation ATPase